MLTFCKRGEKSFPIICFYLIGNSYVRELYQKQTLCNLQTYLLIKSLAVTRITYAILMK